ncbi:MAG: 4Fe-4S binding protein [Anaerolineales bacterium]|nr:4Fe-4S binding protein [Anaerolineales bacterium]
MNHTSKPRRWITPSTIQFTKEALRQPNYSFCDWLHGMIYGRWVFLYISIGVGEHPLAKVYRRIQKALKWLPWWAPKIHSTPSSTSSVANGYHGKVMPVTAAARLISINQEIRLTNLEKVIPYPRARDIVLKNPDHIVALQCPCRSARANPCLPLDVCLVVGEPFASFVIDHHPQKARWITQEEAVAILKAEHARGHVQHAFFKDAMLGRFYAICNCCSCCCGAMQAYRHGTPMLASSGYVCEVNQDLCLACGECTERCPFDAITVDDDRATIDFSACMGCGVCIDACPQWALSLRREASKGVPLEV